MLVNIVLTNNQRSNALFKNVRFPRASLYFTHCDLALTHCCRSQHDYALGLC